MKKSVLVLIIRITLEKFFIPDINAYKISIYKTAHLKSEDILSAEEKIPHLYCDVVENHSGVRILSAPRGRFRLRNTIFAVLMRTVCPRTHRTCGLSTFGRFLEAAAKQHRPRMFPGRVCLMSGCQFDVIPGFP